MADDIIRENPYGQDQPSAPATYVNPNANLTAADRAQQEAFMRGNQPASVQMSPTQQQGVNPNLPEALNQGPPATSPLSTTDYLKQQIGSAEIRKGLTAEQEELKAQGLSREAEIRQKAAAEDLARQNESRAALQKAMADADARDAALRKQIQQTAAMKPLTASDAWNQRSTGSKILAGIGVFLGGLGTGLQHRGPGENPAMQIINKAIDSDIEASREHIANSWKGISQQHELDNNAFNRELHRQVWENNYRTASYERVKMELASNAAKTTSETTRQNALIGIQDLTDAQAKIRNQQYVLGQQAAMANAARIRKLTEEAGKQVMELVKEKGVDPTDAEQFVYQQPQYRELMGAGLVPRSVAQLPALRTQAAAELEKLKGYGYNEADAMKKLQENPTYAPLFKARGPIVPPGREGMETEEQLRARTVIVNGQPVQTMNKGAAEDYKDFQDSQTDVNRALAELKDAWAKGDVGRYNAARGQLIDSMPKYMLGSKASGPTRAQATETYGKLIPEYSHWYGYPAGTPGHEKGLFSPIGKGIADPQSRVDEALGTLQRSIDQRAATIEANTFGKPMPPQDTGAPSVGFQKKIDFTPTISVPVVKRPKE